MLDHILRGERRVHLQTLSNIACIETRQQWHLPNGHLRIGIESFDFLMNGRRVGHQLQSIFTRQRSLQRGHAMRDRRRFDLQQKLNLLGIARIDGVVEQTGNIQASQDALFGLHLS